MRTVAPPSRFTDAFTRVVTAEQERIDRVRDRAAFILRIANGRIDITRPWVEVYAEIMALGGGTITSATEDAWRLVEAVINDHMRAVRARQAVEAEEAQRDAEAEAVAAEALAELHPEQRRAIARLSSRLGGLLDGRATPEEE